MGAPEAMASTSGLPKVSTREGKDEKGAATIEIGKVAGRDVTKEPHMAAQIPLGDGSAQGPGVVRVDGTAGDPEIDAGKLAAQDDERVEQAVQILLNVEIGDAEQEVLAPGAGRRRREQSIDAVVDDFDAPGDA